MIIRPLPGVSEPETLITIREGTADGAFFTMSVPEMRGLASLPGLSGLAAHADASVNVSRDASDPARVKTDVVTPNYFDVLGQTMTLGRSFGAEEEEAGQSHRVIVSHAYWTSQLGADRGAIGRTLRINDQPFTIVGVAAEGFRGPSRSGSTNLWVPLASHTVTMPSSSPRSLTSTVGMFFSVYGRLSPGSSVAIVQDQAEAFRRQLLEDNPKLRKLSRVVFSVKPGVDVPVWQSERLRQTFALLIGVVGLILLLACANVGTLLLARAHERQAEVATRMALGASRRRVIRQWLLEGVVVCAAGAAGALLISAWLGQLVEGLVVTQTVPELSRVDLDWRVFSFAVAVSAFAGLAGSLLPAVVGSRVDLVGALKQAGRGQAPAGRRLRRALTIVQVAVSVVLLCGAFLFLRSMSERYAVPLGYDTESVLAFSLEPGLRHKEEDAQRRVYRDVISRLSALPSVAAAGLAWIEPFKMIGGGGGLKVPGAPEAGEIRADGNMVSAGYFEALGVRFLAGRSFSDAESFRDDKDGGGVVILNETLAKRLFGSISAVGRQVEMTYPEGRKRTVVGVVSDLRTRSLDKPVGPTVYEPFGQSFMSGWATMHLRVRTTVADVLPQVREAVRAVDPGMPLYDVETLRDSLNRHLAEARLVTHVVTGFALVAMLLAAIGLYGVVSRSVAERQREFGIRAALGAAPAGVARLVLREALVLTLAGAAAGLAGAVWLGRFAESRLFGVTASDPLSLAATVACVVSAGLLAALWPALRASRASLTATLRS
jgi:predicted permease